MVCDADGKKRSVLTKDGTNCIARWSPDGRKLAFTRGSPAEKPVLFVMDADGAGQRELLRGLGSYAWRP